jgi:type II restriction enzyme
MGVKMANMNFYKKFLDVGNIDELAELFNRTLIDTNMTYKYFVDWEKIKRNVNRLNVEINILNSLIGSKDVRNDLMDLLRKYPEIVTVFPLIIAVRDNELKIIEDVDIKKYSFKRKTSLTEPEIKSMVHFCVKSGIIELFSDIKIKNLKDYLLGVEVGMDTNARKNRSGQSMELIVMPIINSFRNKYNDLEIIFQKTFKYIKENYGVQISQSLINRKFDFVLKKGDKFVNIEVNYYSGGGSKPQEIVNSYINRQNELKKSKWGFIWITDGLGWRVGFNQIKVGFNNIDYLLNLNFVKRGVLEEIIKNL